MQYPDYDPASPNTPLGNDELEALDELLAMLPADGAMTLDGMDGYLTALIVGPRPLVGRRSADWLPAIWGGDPDDSAAPFASNQKKKRTTVLVLRHLQALVCQLRDAPAAWEPIFAVAEQAGPGKEDLADASDWCMGFLQAVDLEPEDWQPLFADADTGPGLAAIARLGGDEVLGAEADGEAGDDEEDLDDPIVRDALSRLAAETVLALHARNAAA